MAKKDDRPLDAGLAALRGKDEATAIEFWKHRFGLISAIPVDTARVGALTPQLRELVRIEDREERKRLTAARLKAFVQLPEEQKERIIKTRQAAYASSTAGKRRESTVMNSSERILARSRRANGAVTRSG